MTHKPIELIFNDNYLNPVITIKSCFTERPDILLLHTV